MYPRTEYEMTEDDFKELMEACKSVPVIMVGGVSPRSTQENANDAWEKLGKKMGFDYMTVRPIQGKDNKFFTAVPSETESQREEREAREADEARIKEIAELGKSIDKKMARIKELRDESNAKS